MAAYPSFPQLIGSTEGWVDDLVLDRAVDGSVYGRAFYPAKKRTFELRHIVGNTDLATFKAFYDTNRLIPVEMTWVRDGEEYSCRFNGAPRLTYIDRNLTELLVPLLEE